MKIQYMSYSGSKTFDDAGSEYEVQTTKLSEFEGFGQFDLNIVDVSDAEIWKSRSTSPGSIDCIADFSSISERISRKPNSIVIIKLPSNVDYHYMRLGNNQSVKLKDCLSTFRKLVKELIGEQHSVCVQYERLQHKQVSDTLSSDFVFEESQEPGSRLYMQVSSTEHVNRCVTLKRRGSDVYVTTLQLTTAQEVFSYLQGLGVLSGEKESAPSWFEEVIMFDDNKQNEIISIEEQKIKNAQEKIKQAKAQLEENKWYKSALYKANQELEKVVADILGQIIDQDLSGFQDNKNEDQRFEIDGIAYIVEIKGTTKNVRRDFVSQLDTHVQQYIEDQEVKEESVKGLLVCNPQREKRLKERDSVHENQIQLAKRNGSLIITTETLLKLLEKKLSGAISREQIVKEFGRTGLLDA